MTNFNCASVLFHQRLHFLSFLFVEGFVQGAQQKEVIVALFVKRFKSFITEVLFLLIPVH